MSRSLINPVPERGSARRGAVGSDGAMSSELVGGSTQEGFACARVADPESTKQEIRAMFDARSDPDILPFSNETLRREMLIRGAWVPARGRRVAAVRYDTLGCRCLRLRPRVSRRCLAVAEEWTRRLPHVSRLRRRAVGAESPRPKRGRRRGPRRTKRIHPGVC